MTNAIAERISAYEAVTRRLAVLGQPVSTSLDDEVEYLLTGSHPNTSSGRAVTYATVTLEMTQDEARALRSLVTYVSGDFETQRKYTDNIGIMLDAAGISWPDPGLFDGNVRARAL